MELQKLLNTIKKHPQYHQSGMVLCHNGVVRATSRDGREVSGLTVKVDHQKLHQVIEENKKNDGIIDILVEIAEDRFLKVGDDVMYIVVAGDVRENVISAMTSTLNDVKATVTHKTESYI